MCQRSAGCIEAKPTRDPALTLNTNYNLCGCAAHYSEPEQHCGDGGQRRLHHITVSLIEMALMVASEVRYTLVLDASIFQNARQARTQLHSRAK